MIIADMHMHTNFSKDSTSTPVSMIEESIRRGLKVICITDHYDQDNFDWEEEQTFDPDEYFDVFRRLQEQYADKIDLRIGVEIGIQPYLPPFYQELVSKHPYDFVIGSAHLIHKKDIAAGELLKDLDDHESFEMILEEMVEDSKKFTNEFDVMGHIDYFVRYTKEKNKLFSYQKYADYIDEILKNVIYNGRGIEVNTSGFKYGLSQAHPCNDIVKRYRELGGEIITIGADGHEPRHIAYDFYKVPEILKECGFKYYSIFKQRKPEFLLIP